jgi:hypothetical protein
LTHTIRTLSSVNHTGEFTLLNYALKWYVWLIENLCPWVCSATIRPDFQLDPSSSFGSTPDASYDDLLLSSSPANGLDSSLLSLSPVGDDASFYARMYGGEVGGLSFLERELIKGGGKTNSVNADSVIRNSLTLFCI